MTMVSAKPATLVSTSKRSSTKWLAAAKELPRSKRG
ncbi:unnamed protein product [Aureobasidium pullulans]|nr:unnamed protein product [Aureobasidium pullulans]CAD0046278.1 unnamed protein product [Aureobasidium pullulans]